MKGANGAVKNNLSKFRGSERNKFRLPDRNGNGLHRCGGRSIGRIEFICNYVRSLECGCEKEKKDSVSASSETISVPSSLRSKCSPPVEDAFRVTNT